MDPKELEQREHLAEEDADSIRRAVSRITLLNEPLRHHESDGSLTAESTGELGEDREVGVQPDTRPVHGHGAVTAPTRS
jgi:hypothetical protein